MSLNWDATATPAYKAGYKDSDDGYSQTQEAICNSLPFWLIATGSPYGGMDEETINRILAWQGVTGSLMMNAKGGVNISREMLSDFLGFRTNVGKKTRTEFMKSIAEWRPSNYVIKEHV